MYTYLLWRAPEGWFPGVGYHMETAEGVRTGGLLERQACNDYYLFCVISQ